ncbi:hypothetical protein ACQRBR_05335 [Desulfovibrio sp. SGI.133]
MIAFLWEGNGQDFADKRSHSLGHPKEANKKGRHAWRPFLVEVYDSRLCDRLADGAAGCLSCAGWPVLSDSDGDHPAGPEKKF